MPVQTNLILSIDPGFKTIPYSPAERPEGSTCHGFKLLKGKPDADARAIVEVSDLPCLADAVVAINLPETSFFTVGCEKAFNQEGDSFWMRGYIEFCFDYVNLAGDAAAYFVAFFHFSEFVRERGFNEPVQFHWELQSCSFLDAEREMGFACTVWITTANGPSEPVVRTAWCSAVTLLAEYLRGLSMHGARRIYGAA